MKKREVLLTLAAIAVIGLSGCGTQKLALVSDHVELELGSELDTTVTSYVADEKVAEDAVLDFSAVDISKVGTYTVPVTYNDQTASFEVEVVDTTAPVVECEDTVTVEVNTALSAENVITSITELSGAVEVTITETGTATDEDAVEEVTMEATEMVESTEVAEDTEAVEAEATEAVEETEVIEDTAIVLEPFTVDDVLCSNDYVIFAETGEYDALITVADASGNTTEALVHVVVGEAPVISGVEDIIVTVGADEVDYLDGVTAVDCNGNDITDKIVCDSSIVDLENVGEYGIVYTVVDENGFEAHATALVAVKEKSSGRTDSASSNSSKPNSTTTSGTSSTASSTTSTSTSTQSQSSQTTYSQDTSSSYDTSSQNNQTATQTPSADTTTSSNTSSVDTSTQTPSVDTSASTPSVDTSTSTSTDGGMSVPDNINIGSMEDYDNTGTGGAAGTDVIEGGNF